MKSSNAFGIFAVGIAVVGVIVCVASGAPLWVALGSLFMALMVGTGFAFPWAYMKGARDEIKKLSTPEQERSDANKKQQA